MFESMEHFELKMQAYDLEITCVFVTSPITTLFFCHEPAHQYQELETKAAKQNSYILILTPAIFPLEKEEGLLHFKTTMETLCNTNPIVTAL